MFRLSMKITHSFFRCFFDRGRSVSIQTHYIQIIAAEIFKTSKGITRNVFANALISISPENLTPHYSLVFSRTQVKSVFYEIETIGF